MTKELEKALRHIKTRADLWAVREVEQALYEATIDKMQQLVDRLKTERMSQAEFEQYAKEHGYIISTTNIIEQIRAEIERLHYHPKLDFIKNDEVVEMALEIIDKYKGDKE